MMRELMRGLFVLWMGFSLVGGCCFGAMPFVAAEDGGAAQVPPAPVAPSPVTPPAGTAAATEPPPIEPVQRATEVWLEPRLSEDAWRALERAPVPQVAGALTLFEGPPPHEGGALERARIAGPRELRLRDAQHERVRLEPDRAASRALRGDQRGRDAREGIEDARALAGSLADHGLRPRAREARGVAEPAVHRQALVRHERRRGHDQPRSESGTGTRSSSTVHGTCAPASRSRICSASARSESVIFAVPRRASSL